MSQGRGRRLRILGTFGSVFGLFVLIIGLAVGHSNPGETGAGSGTGAFGLAILLPAAMVYFVGRVLE